MKNFFTLRIFFSSFLLVIIGFTGIAQPKLWGTTFDGGSSNGGVIFSIVTGDTVMNSVHHVRSEVCNPDVGDLLKASDGNYYGTGYQGGDHATGALFRFNPATNELTELFQFSMDFGINPINSMVEGPGHKLYGVANGGPYNSGVLFEFDFATLTMTDTCYFNGGNGSMPNPIMKASSGKIYGMTNQGGASNAGVLYEYNMATHVMTVKHHFNGTDGRPYTNSLTEAPTGKFYAATFSGGINEMGTIFEYDAVTDTLITKIHFDSTGNGPYYVTGKLGLGVTGNFYGVTMAGGTYDKGVIYEYNYLTNVLTVKQHFDGINTGSAPRGSSPVSMSNNLMYGTTEYGGANNKGILYAYNPATNTLTKKLDFDEMSTGANPVGSPVEDGSGKYYGAVLTGGQYKYGGVIYAYDPVTNNYTRAFDLVGPFNVQAPPNSLFLASNNLMYGGSVGGGSYGGTVYSFDRLTDDLNFEADFWGICGKSPHSPLMQATNGKLYGLALRNGVCVGVPLYELDISTGTTTFNVLTYIPGTNAYGQLVQATNGNLYGLIHDAGVTTHGSLFSYTIATNTYNVIHNFDYTSGSEPYGSMIQMPSGKMYGTTSKGGVHGEGVLFEFNPSTNAYVKKIEFDGTNGSAPYCTPILAPNGKLYGLTKTGGTTGYGTIFEYTIATNTLVTKFNFDLADGIFPQGSLLLSSNGKMYGLTTNGGDHFLGTLFEYDYVTNTFTKKLDFNGPGNGSHPYLTSLIEVDDSGIGINESPMSASAVSVYPNPTGSYVHIGQTMDEVRVYGLAGQLVKTAAYTNQVSLSDLPSGLYLLVLKDEFQRLHYRKIVKE